MLHKVKDRQWHDVLSSHLCGRKWRKQYQIIIYYLICVNEGLKPSLLWDIGPNLNIDTLKNLIEDLKCVKLLNNYIYLLEYEHEMFVINLFIICKYLDLLSKSIQFIDCSSNIEQPSFINGDRDETCLNVNDSFNLIVNKMNEFYDIHENSGFKNHEILRLNVTTLGIDIQANKCVCPPAIFGILLCYPVVYYVSTDSYSDEINATNGNCLSMVPLHVYKVQTKDFPFDNNYDLYSFSVPVSLNVTDIINFWFNNVLKYISNGRVLFELSSNVVTLPSVQL